MRLGLTDRVRLANVRRRMRKDWDRRAREDALHYVHSGRRDWDTGEFFATGEQNVREQITPDLDDICRGRSPSDMRVLEIGCGVGRMTRALAGVFGEVHGVDVSPEMVTRAKRYLANTSNVSVHCNSGTDLEVLGDLEFDFAYSFIVFQHIPSQTVIDGYVGEVARRLRPNSLFKVQMQGYQGKEMLLDRSNTWVGASVSEAQAREMAARHGLEVLRSSGAGTQYFWLWLLKPA